MALLFICLAFLLLNPIDHVTSEWYEKIMMNIKNLLNANYIGSDCYGKSFFPPDKCKPNLYGFCSPYEPSCAMWKTGTFVNPAKTIHFSSSDCSEYWSGHFGPSGLWESPHCPVRWYTPEELRLV